MTYQLVSYLLMILIFLSYVGYIWIKYGVQPSISQSYYKLPEKNRYLFTLFCWGFAIPAIMIGSTFLMFLAGTGIGFVGAAAQIRRKLDHTVHSIAAVSAIIFSQMSIYLDFNLWIINAITLLLFIIIPFLSKNKYIWWMELIAFTAICVAFGILIF
jgi:hypothetical protein